VARQNIKAEDNVIYGGNGSRCRARRVSSLPLHCLPTNRVRVTNYIIVPEEAQNAYSRDTEVFWYDFYVAFVIGLSPQIHNSSSLLNPCIRNAEYRV